MIIHAEDQYIGCVIHLHEAVVAYYLGYLTSCAFFAVVMM